MRFDIRAWVGAAPGNPKPLRMVLVGVSAVVLIAMAVAAWSLVQSRDDQDNQALNYDSEYSAPTPEPDGAVLPDRDGESDAAPSPSDPTPSASSTTRPSPTPSADATRTPPAQDTPPQREAQRGDGSVEATESQEAPRQRESTVGDGTASGETGTGGAQNNGQSSSDGGSHGGSGKGGTGSSGSHTGGSGTGKPADFSATDDAGTGTTFYVDPSAPDGGDGSATDPFGSLQQVLDGGLIESRNWTSFPANGQGTLAPRNPGAPIKAGDTIVLAAGDYGDLSLRGYYNEAPITLKAAKGARPVFTSIYITASSGWVVDGMEVLSGAPYSGKLIEVVGHNHFGPTTDITIANNLVHPVRDASGWSASDWTSREVTGIGVRTDGVTLTGNTVRNTFYAIEVWGDNQTVQHNTIDMFSGDGIRSVGASNSRFVGNRISNSLKLNDHHDDAFQHFPAYYAPDKPTRNVVIRDNVVVHCEGSQNRFCGNLQGIASFDGRLENWTVENNSISTEHWHGLSLYNVHDSVVRGNVVRDPNGAEGVGPTWLRINTGKAGQPSTNVLVECNVAATFVSSEQNKNITMRNNTKSNELGARPPKGC